MLNSKKVTIGDQDITVCEVKVGRILQLLPFMSDGSADGQDDEVSKGFMENLDELLHDCCGIVQEDLKGLHGSELEALWNAFEEVNGFFFKTIARLGLEEKIKELLSTLLSAYGGMFASLLSEATQGASITDLVGSLGPPKIPSGSGETE